MEIVFHILGICPDHHSHLDLKDLLAVLNIEHIWLWLRHWTINILSLLKEKLKL